MDRDPDPGEEEEAVVDVAAKGDGATGGEGARLHVASETKFAVVARNSVGACRR